MKEIDSIKENKYNYVNHSIQTISDFDRKIVKFISNNFGTNIDYNEPKFNNQDNRWEISLNANIVNEIKSYEGKRKKFIMNLQNIGKIYYDLNLNYLSDPSFTSKQLNTAIYQKIWEYRNSLTSFILKKKKEYWGQIPRVKQFMSPLYTSLTHLIVHNEVSNQDWRLIDPKKGNHWKYIKLLSTLPERYVIVGPDITKLGPDLEFLLKKYDNNSLRVVEFIAGEVFCEKFIDLIHDFRLTSLSNYLYLPRTYYSDAIDFGENFHIIDEDLIKKHLLNMNKTFSQYELINLNFLLSELISLKYFETEKEDYNRIVFGEEDLWNDLYRNQSKIKEQIEITEYV